MKKILFAFAALFFVQFCYSKNVFNYTFPASGENGITDDGKEPVFTLNAPLDITVASTGFTLTLTNALIDFSGKSCNLDWTGIRDKDDINSFDRFFAQKYDKTLSNVSNIFRYASFAFPLFLTFKTGFKSFEGHMTYLVMYGETLLWTFGVTLMLKNLVNRARPYTYFEDYPSDILDDKSKDWQKSFPSGHTAPIFASAAFTSYVYWKAFPDSKAKIPISIGLYAAATTTAILRVASGNHFVTDVVTGAVIGTAFGILVPFIHQKRFYDKKSGVEVAVQPMGFRIVKHF